MPYYNVGQPFIVMADPRTGGTFLTHCLSSHPDLYCYRKEVLHRRDTPRTVFPRASALQIVRAFVEQQGWAGCGVKLVFKEAQNESILQWMKDVGAKAILLEREHSIRVAISRMLTALHRKGSQIDYPNERREPGVPNLVEVDALGIIASARKYEAGLLRMADTLEDLNIDTIRIKYADMIGGEGSVTQQMERGPARDLCRFLGVSSRTLRCRLYPSAPAPIRSFVSNWPELRIRMVNSEFADLLNIEDRWPSVGDEDGTEELKEDQGPIEGPESGSGEPDSIGSDQSRSDDAQEGDQFDLGSELPTVAVE